MTTAGTVELPYRIVDVFTDRPLAGNALCVVLEPAPEPVMQAIAREVNLSETTFVTRTGGGATGAGSTTYDVRIFTPTAELPFAGHPTLGTAWALGPGTWTQRSPGTTVTVEVTETHASLHHADPTIVEVDHADATAGLGLAPHAASAAYLMDVGGTRHVLVPTTQPLDALRFDIERLRAVTAHHGSVGIAAMRASGDAEVHVRLVIVGAGVFEDPGTGSAAGAVGLVARREWGLAEDIVIRQGDEIGRPCRIDVHAVAGDVRVGGAVASCAEGMFRLGSG